MKRIALIGLGEVGGILAEDLAGRADLTAFDVKMQDAGSAPARCANRLQLYVGDSAAAAARAADIVISAVTAAQTLAAARSVTGGMAKGAVFLDLNSASPGV